MLCDPNTRGGPDERLTKKRSRTQQRGQGQNKICGEGWYENEKYSVR